jgi:hypothetical protein
MECRDTGVVVFRAALRRWTGGTAPGGAGRAACVLVICWTFIGAAGFAYLFASSTVPVTEPGESGYFGSPWLQGIAVMCGVLFGLPSFVLPLVWLPIGLYSLRRHRCEVWRHVAWIAGTAPAVALEAAATMGAGVAAIAPTYLGAPIVSWVWLPESGSFLAIGVTLAAIQTVGLQRPHVVPI